MTIEIKYYNNEKNSIKNVSAIDFDGEKGELNVLGYDGKVVSYRMVKGVECFGIQ